jgi:hypothetical protein
MLFGRCCTEWKGSVSPSHSHTHTLTRTHAHTGPRWAAGQNGFGTENSKSVVIVFARSVNFFSSPLMLPLIFPHPCREYVQRDNKHVALFHARQHSASKRSTSWGSSCPLWCQELFDFSLSKRRGLHGQNSQDILGSLFTSIIYISSIEQGS